jgi:hypothetical protein
MYKIGITTTGRHFIGIYNKESNSLLNALEFQIIPSTVNKIMHIEYQFYYYVNPVLLVGKNKALFHELRLNDMMVVIDLDDLHENTTSKLLPQYLEKFKELNPRFASNEELEKSEPKDTEGWDDSDAEPKGNVIQFTNILNKKKSVDS